MTDPRFANPPEELELPPTSEHPVKSKKGKGRLMEGPTSKKATTTTTGKRKQASHEPSSDSEGDLYDEVLNGPLPSTSQAVVHSADDKADEEDEGEGHGNDEDNDEPLNLLPKVLQVDNVNEFNKKVDMTGLIYLSRIPPGMGPSKVKHILSNYGEIGRIYLVAADTGADGGKKKSHNSSKPGKENHKHKHQAHRFIEGWVEFMDKRVARSTAELLNAKTIGDVALSKTSKKNGGTKKWKDDVWTMKYLPRFKWNMLSEQVGECFILFYTGLADTHSILFDVSQPSKQLLEQLYCAMNSLKARRSKLNISAKLTELRTMRKHRIRSVQGKRGRVVLLQAVRPMLARRTKQDLVRKLRRTENSNRDLSSLRIKAVVSSMLNWVAYLIACSRLSAEFMEGGAVGNCIGILYPAAMLLNRQATSCNLLYLSVGSIQFAREEEGRQRDPLVSAIDQPIELPTRRDTGRIARGGATCVGLLIINGHCFSR